MASDKKGAQKRAAKLAFLDESGFSLKPSVRRTWAPRGKTPHITTHFNWKRLNVIGSLICDPDGKEADAISFGDDDSVFDPPPRAPSAGKTVGSRLPGGDPDGGNWALTQRPTPGQPNEFPPAATPTTNARDGRTAGLAAPSGSTQATVNRGEGRNSILWIVGAVAAASVILGAAPAWRRYRKKSDVGS